MRTFVSFSIAACALALLLACASEPERSSSATAVSDGVTKTAAAAGAPSVNPAEVDTATFAGGCFWCMEPPFDRLDGVEATISGFSGGTKVDPTYREVAYGRTDHTEVVQVIYDPEQVSYERLLFVYWRNVDPLDDEGQFCDRGSQYRPAIFAHTPEQKRLAEASLEDVKARFDQTVKVPVHSFDAFYAAEEYHQNFYKKNPDHYTSYRNGCGRDQRLRALWGDEANAPKKAG